MQHRLGTILVFALSLSACASRQVEGPAPAESPPAVAAYQASLTGL